MRYAGRTWAAAAGAAAAAVLGIVLYQAAGAQAGRPAQRPGAPGMQRPMGPGGGMPPGMAQMMQRMQKTRAQMEKLDGEIDRLAATMNKSTGQKKIDAMAAIINKMVEQRRLQRQMMGSRPGMPMMGGPGMRPGMMGGGAPPPGGRRP